MADIPNELIEAVRNGTASDINIAAVDAARASLPGNGQNGVRLASEVRRLTCEAIVAERETRPPTCVLDCDGLHGSKESL